MRANRELESSRDAVGPGFDPAVDSRHPPALQLSQNSIATDDEPGGAWNASPVETVKRLVGATHVTLHGFSGVVMPQIWFRPGLQMLEPTGSTQESQARASRRASVMKSLRLATLALALLGAGCLGAWITTALSPVGRAPAAVVSEWSPVAVTQSGLTVKVGAGSGAALMQIPLGGSLPNGEKLQATFPQRRAFITASGTTLLRDVALERGGAP